MLLMQGLPDESFRCKLWSTTIIRHIHKFFTVSALLTHLVENLVLNFEQVLWGVELYNTAYVQHKNSAII